MKALIVAAAIAAAGVSCTSPAPPPRAAAPHADVVLARAEASQIPVTFEAGGVVRGRLTASIASRVMAPVVAVNVKAGDRVSAGAPLVTLDGRDLQAQAARASAALTAARDGVLAANSEKRAADAALTLATTSFDRVKGLHAKRSATNAELEDATAAFDSARARASGAAARAGEAAAALTAAEENSKAAAITASYAVVTAPFGGRVAERLVDPGAMAAPGAPLLSLEDTSLVQLEVSLDETRASRVAVNQQVRYRLDDDAVWQSGRVAEIARIDPARHSFTVKIDLPSASDARTGSFGRARFAGDMRTALVVPATAVFRRGQLSFVFAVDGDGFARLRAVMTGETAGDRLEVLSGVAEGEAVVDHPPLSLGDGTRVTAGAGQ